MAVSQNLSLIRICSRCKKTKNRTEFYIYKKNGWISQPCKQCKSEIGHTDKERTRRREYKRKKYNYNARKPRETNPNIIKQKRQGYKLKYRYNLSQKDWNKRYLQQNGVCMICGKPETSIDNNTGNIRKLGFDHNHKTGQIRDLLCTKCNLLVSNACEDITILQAAIRYLEKWSNDF